MSPRSHRVFRSLRRTAAYAAVGALGAVLAVLAMPAPARSAVTPPPVATKTHLGAAPRDHVVLALAGATGARTFRRVLADGTFEATPYVVPKGAALYVTDVEYVSGWTNGSRGPFERALRLAVVSDANTAQRGTVAYPAGLPQTGPDDGTHIDFSGSGRLTSGFVVGFGAHLEVDTPERLDAATGDPVAQAIHGDVVVRGYLVKDR